MRTLKLTIAYDGTRLVGWQRQARGVSVQGLLEEAMAPLEGGRRVIVTGAGRTDAGVHASGQVASCRVANALDEAALARALNARLPAEVRVRAVEVVPDTFHARFGAIAKTYAYHVLNGPVADPLARHATWHVVPRLDVTAVAAALGALPGTHDFKAFQASGSHVRDTVRTLFEAVVSARPWPGVLEADAAAPDVEARTPVPTARLVSFRFRGDGFLRHMVRTLVGTAVEVGLGRREPGEIAAILATGDRQHAGVTAPPHGLVLVHVDYGSPDPRSICGCP